MVFSSSLPLQESALSGWQKPTITRPASDWKQYPGAGHPDIQLVWQILQNKDQAVGRSAFARQINH